MSSEEQPSIPLEAKNELDSSYKITSYLQKLKMMEEKQIPQKPIEETVAHFFSDENKIIPNKVKESISKIIYSEKDRIIIAITNSGKDIIWKRAQLIKEYGWFFFVTASDEKPTQKKKKKNHNKAPPKTEETISKEVYQVGDQSIGLKQKINMRSLYRTKEYNQYLSAIQKRKTHQKPIKELLDEFFSKFEQIPEKEKKSIQKIIYYEQEKVVVIKSLIGDKMYENLKHLVRRFGWYFYITGVPVGSSEISLAVDKIEKRFSIEMFNDISLIENPESVEKPKVTLYPIALKPNHNCLILGLGDLNILLDCGISEEYFVHIEYFLENLKKLKVEAEAETVEIYEPSERQRLDEIAQLRKFEYAPLIPQEELEDIEEKGEKNPVTESRVDVNKAKFDAIFISHSHYDHVSGLKELVKTYPDVPILCSRITLDLYLLRDSAFLKQEVHDEIEEEEYQNIVKNVIYVENGTKVEFKSKNCHLSFFHAGHMPGALMMSAKVIDYRFLFTGDYTYWDFTPFAGTRRFLEQISKPIDFLLIDASSAHEEFGHIQDQLSDLIQFLEMKAEYGDNCLLGADPSSLAITFMLTIWRHFRKLQIRQNYQKRPNIYVDMMVRKNIQVINHRYEYIYGPISKLIRDKANPFNSIKFRWFDHSDLEFLKTRNNIIISHPPDLSYGIIRNIINQIGRNNHNLVYLSGGIHEEPGESLVYPQPLEEGEEKPEYPEVILSDTWKFPFRAMLLNHFAPNLKIKLHGDKNQLFEMIKNLEPKEVCFFHQSPKKLIEVAEEVRLTGVGKVSIPPKRTLLVLN